MNNLEKRIEILKEAKKRVSQLAFGDPVTNVCAGKSNPQRHGYFVRIIKRTGRLNKGWWIECTDKKGKFWSPSVDVIYSGHLNYEQCEELFRPVWEANYG